MKATKKSMILAIVLILTLSLLSACAVQPEQKEPSGYLDGEIGSNPAGDSGSSFWDGLFGGSGLKGDAADAPSASAPEYAPSAPGDAAEGGVMDGEIGGGTGGGSFEHQAGQLTGSEWNDNDHFADFVQKLRRQDSDRSDWYYIANSWGMIATNRLHVKVQNGQTPVKLARVQLLDAAGEVLWNAVTDADGDAYLFWNIGAAEQVPAEVKVTATDGKTATVNALAGVAEAVQNGTPLTIELEAENAPVKLDVMFMIDTTGSMGDELEYLKAEMGDVIRRVAGESNITVRTAVNFYRDRGDEYELRYYDFRENVDQAVEILSRQHASGGGDYEEAVDTALDYAINTQIWDEDAVKLMFLVLDAPPHRNDQTIETISAAIRRAAEQGIRIIPVASSGVDTTCQVLFRTWAALTGGTYTFLTDHSGIGGSHETPEVEQITVELLNQMLVRIIKEYCK